MEMLNDGQVRLVCPLCGTGVVRALTDDEKRHFNASSDESYEIDCRICHGLLLALLRRTNRRRSWLYDGPKYGRLSA